MKNTINTISALIIVSIIVSGCQLSLNKENIVSTAVLENFETDSINKSNQVTEDNALNALHAYLKETKEPHKLCTDCPDKSSIVIIGDLNSDGQLDAIVQYTFEPSEDDMQFGQSAIYNCAGFLVLENRNNTLIPIQNVPIVDVLTFSTTEYVTIKEINQQGDIILEKTIDTDFEPEFSNESGEKFIVKRYKTKLFGGKIRTIDSSIEKPIN